MANQVQHFDILPDEVGPGKAVKAELRLTTDPHTHYVTFLASRGAVMVKSTGTDRLRVLGQSFDGFVDLLVFAPSGTVTIYARVGGAVPVGAAVVVT